MERGAIIAGQSTGEAIFSIAIGMVSLALCVAFAYFAIADPARLTALWEWTRSLNILLQGVIWLLFLPWMIALRIWTLAWALPVRAILVAAALLWTSWVMWPWKS